MQMAPFVTSSKRAALRALVDLQSVGIRDVLIDSVKEKNQILILSRWCLLATANRMTKKYSKQPACWRKCKSAHSSYRQNMF